MRPYKKSVFSPVSARLSFIIASAKEHTQISFLLRNLTPSSPGIRTLLCISIVSVLSACAVSYNPLDDFKEVRPSTAMQVPDPDFQQTTYDTSAVKHGKYLVGLLGCANCHTDGALIGEPDSSKQLAGSSIGIAYSNPLEDKYPGVVYPSNLTPDSETGIQNWSDIELMKMLRSGVDRHGIRKLSVMPWPAYSVVSDDDALAIASYLRSLPPVNHRVPTNVKPGEKASSIYVHFGMYQNRLK
jgi:mono/diheme cytochrome c family protein